MTASATRAGDAAIRLKRRILRLEGALRECLTELRLSNLDTRGNQRINTTKARCISIARDALEEEANP